MIAPKVTPAAMRPIGLFLCGTVAVNHQGVRLGKGAGYSDIEFAMVREAGLVGPDTLVATTVHDLQVLDEPLPEDDHDFRVDLIITPTRTVRCGRPRRPAGLLWDRLAPEKIAAIPYLAERAADQA
ncbi:5-formyltetrahydrofolate cyclo-ligase [Actinomadura gamaensis]|uniref:5-formyltetrahydrofolate cyclo-ligase n=1 Tax=Actinomadura gamaensis TaxID=1763541 RepID=A0ABV9U095_9ACTN